MEDELSPRTNDLRVWPGSFVQKKRKDARNHLRDVYRQERISESTREIKEDRKKETTKEKGARGWLNTRAADILFKTAGKRREGRSKRSQLADW